MSTRFEISSCDEYLNTIHDELKPNGEGKRRLYFRGQSRLASDTYALTPSPLNKSNEDVFVNALKGELKKMAGA